MIHYYFLNQKIKNFKIAKIKKKIIFRLNSKKLFYKKISSFDEIKNKLNFNEIKNNLPFKSELYIKRRYFNNPNFKYEFFLINKKNLLIGREIHLKK